MSDETTQIIHWAERLRAGDESAMNELLVHFEARLVSLTRKMLKKFPAVQRWEQTDDVFIEASLRLHRALRTVTPRSTREFFGLATLQIRRELLNMSDVYMNRLGPSRLGSGETDHSAPIAVAMREPVDQSDAPSEMEMWTVFHQAAANLPDEIREAFQLIWYGGLAQAEAATIVGVSLRTMKGRWQEARLAIHRAMNGQLPGN
jgi:RNA polymerase sigma-70 factor (ECF subfamily)